MTRRVETLDYLRGMMALIIMVYHFSHWRVFDIPSDLQPPLDLLGKYAVSIFFILSGAALFMMYSERIGEARWLTKYLLKRFFRIAPLLWLVTITTILISKDNSVANIVLNMSLMFSFLAPDKYIAVGAWSIGNEVVFYVTLPFILMVAQRRFGLSAVVLASWFMCIYFAYIALSGAGSLSNQWSTYVNPLNQVHLFVSGIAVGAMILKWRGSKPWFALSAVILSFIGILTFSYFYEGIELVTGWRRVVVSLLCVFFCLAVGIVDGGFDVRLKAGFLVAKVLGFLGAISYSVYLLHPLVIEVAKYFKQKSFVYEMHPMVLTALVLFVSSIAYFSVEKPGLNLGRRIASWLKGGAAPASEGT